MADAEDQLSVGDTFPAIELDTPDGKAALADRLAEGPAVVAFERHFG